MTPAELFEANQALAAYHARTFVRRGVDRSDLEQEALIALWEASETYDPVNHPAVKFTTFASVVIRWHLLDVLRHASRGPVPQRVELRLVAAPPAGSGDEHFWEELAQVLKSLTRSERAILSGWLGLGADAKPQSIAQLMVRHRLSRYHIRKALTKAVEALAARLDLGLGSGPISLRRFQRRA